MGNVPVTPAACLLSVAAPRAAGPCPLHTVGAPRGLEAVCSLRDTVSLAGLGNPSSPSSPGALH